MSEHTARDNLTGSVIMMGSMAAFTFNDVVLKTLSGEVPLFQAIFLRGCIVTAVLFAFVALTGQWKLGHSAKDWGRIGLRTIGEIGATLAFLTALFNAPIGSVTAVLQAAPLVITLAGAVLLGEKVGWRRYGAIGVGLIGVLLIVRPTSDGFNPFVLFSVLALGFILLRDLPTRRLSKSVPSVFVALVASAAITATGGVALIGADWAPLSRTEILTLAGAAGFLLIAYVLAVMVMRIGEIAVVQPFRYTAILWALALGYLVFDERPDAPTLLGVAIVVTMGVYTFYRERRVRG
ncbi:MAG: DMT family transporter [Paracoccaceae bacterium]|jgi:S-adenosylmethionine uptake transporter|nr:DMT family transporter [Paracoccaceae bacterium]MDP7184841.1 DMT family transporter [Paracoccaceae bacterium]